MTEMSSVSEDLRLRETRISNVPWRKWGPYLSERQWGTVREDYSAHGAAWDYPDEPMNTSMATTAPASGPAIRPAGPDC